MLVLLLVACTGGGGDTDTDSAGTVLYTDHWELIADLRDVGVAGPEAQHPTRPLDLYVDRDAFLMPAERQIAGQDWFLTYVRHQPDQGTYYSSWAPSQLETPIRGVRSGQGNRAWVLGMSDMANQPQAYVFHDDQDAFLDARWAHATGDAERHLAAIGGTFTALATGVINGGDFGTVKLYTASAAEGVQQTASLPGEPPLVSALGLGLDGFDPVVAYAVPDDPLTLQIARYAWSTDAWEPSDTVALEAPLYMGDVRERMRLDVISVFAHDGATAIVNRRPDSDDHDLHVYHQPTTGAAWEFGAITLAGSTLHDLEHIDGVSYAVSCDDPAVACQAFAIEGTEATPIGAPLPDIFSAIQITAADGRAFLATGHLDAMILGEVQ